MVLADSKMRPTVSMSHYLVQRWDSKTFLSLFFLETHKPKTALDARTTICITRRDLAGTTGCAGTDLFDRILDGKSRLSIS